MVYRFTANAIKISISCFAEIKKILKFIWNLKGPQVVKSVLRKNKVGGLTLSDFKIYCKTTVIKQYGTGIKTDQKNATENPEINFPYMVRRSLRKVPRLHDGKG